jgi:hypothetical protein
MFKKITAILLLIYSNVFASEIYPPFYIVKEILISKEKPEKLISHFAFENSILKKKKNKKELLELIKKIKSINFKEFEKINDQAEKIIVKTNNNTTLHITFHIVYPKEDENEEKGPGMYYKFKSIIEN